MFDSIFTQVASTSYSLGDFLLCSVVSLALGLVIALTYMFHHRYSRNFVITIAVLPLIVQLVISLVNGNIGAGVAVMGVFSLVRFRSIPGSARDIGSVFCSMAVGLATGMGYLTLAAVFTVVVACANMLYTISPFARKAGQSNERALHVTVPEDLDYTDMFDDLFARYTRSHELVRVKTTNMGSLFQIDYEVCLKDPRQEKRFIDELRTRNGNLQIVCGRPESREEL
jgi:uncharacterized membrane protein YhiD involved in acid resistance